MRKSIVYGAAAAWCAAAGLAGCYSSTANHPIAMQSPPASITPTPTASPKATPTPRPTATPTGPTPTPTAQPQVVHVGFQYAEHTDPKYGPVYFYSPTGGHEASVITVKSGSQLVFLNDSNPNSPHTASGLGTSFPAQFDNTSGFTQNGTTIDASLTWSSGTLNPGQMSQVFTVGAPGVYYFGCNYHYAGVPTASNGSMGDVIVST